MLKELILLLLLKHEQGVQGLQAFAFYILNVNDEPTKQAWFQKKAVGVKY